MEEDTMELALMALAGAEEELAREPFMLQAMRDSLDDLCIEIGSVTAGGRIPTKVEALQMMLKAGGPYRLSHHDRKMIMILIREMSN